MHFLLFSTLFKPFIYLFIRACFPFTKHHHHYCVVTISGACMRMLICRITYSIHSHCWFQWNDFLLAYNRIFMLSGCADLPFWWDSVALHSEMCIPVCAIVCDHDDFHSTKSWSWSCFIIFADPINALNRTNEIEWIALRLFDWIIIIYVLFHLRFKPRWHLIWHLRNDQKESEFTFCNKIKRKNRAHVYDYDVNFPLLKYTLAKHENQIFPTFAYADHSLSYHFRNSNRAKCWIDKYDKNVDANNNRNVNTGVA